jgi:hypothetical protein
MNFYPKTLLKMDLLHSASHYRIVLLEVGLRQMPLIRVIQVFSLSISSSRVLLGKKTHVKLSDKDYYSYLLTAFADDSGSAVITESQGFNRSGLSLTRSTFASLSSCVPSSG